LVTDAERGRLTELGGCRDKASKKEGKGNRRRKGFNEREREKERGRQSKGERPKNTATSVETSPSAWNILREMLEALFCVEIKLGAH